jgi:hypothetical protein
MAIVGELEPGTQLLDYESLNEIDCSSGIHLTGEKSPYTESVMVPDTPSSHAPWLSLQYSVDGAWMVNGGINQVQ